MDNNENLLLVNVKNGDYKSFEQLFKMFYKLFCLEAFNLLEDKDEAEDVVQNLFVEIWDKKLYQNIEQSFKQYVRRSVRNSCLTILQKRKLKYKYEEQYVANHRIYEKSNQLELKELGMAINGFVNQLPQQRQRAFNLVYVEQLRYNDAALEMGISVNSLKTHLKLTLKTLRNKLENFK